MTPSLIISRRAIIVFLMAITSVNVGIAQDKQSPVRDWLRRAGDVLGSGSLQRTAPEVKEIFKPLVAEAKKSTVRVYSHGKHVALGAVVFDDGYIVTKASELKHDDLLCQFYDGRRLDAKLIGIARDIDLAMLQVEAKDLDSVSWGEATPPVGAFLITTSLRDVPESIGVVSVAPREIERPRGVLGVLLDDANGGAKVSRVLKGSAAEKAGVKSGDVITQVNQKSISSREELVKTIQSFKPDDKIRLELKRGDKELDMVATLGSAFNSAHGERMEFQESLGGPLSGRRAGFPSALQHDTALRPQDCGGPLWDLDGKVIGINIARASRVGSFAIPVATVKAYLEKLRSGELAPGPSVAEQTKKLKQQMGDLKKQQDSLEEKIALYQLMKEQSDEAVADAQKRLKKDAQDEVADGDLRKAQKNLEQQEEMLQELDKRQSQIAQQLKNVEVEIVKLEND